jgi:hypothetical protein
MTKEEEHQETAIQTHEEYELWQIKFTEIGHGG